MAGAALGAGAEVVAGAEDDATDAEGFTLGAPLGGLAAAVFSTGAVLAAEAIGLVLGEPEGGFVAAATPVLGEATFQPALIMQRLNVAPRLV